MSENKPLIELKDILIRPFYFDLSKDYRKYLIEKALKKKKDLKKLSKEIDCYKSFLKTFLKRKTKNKTRFIRYDFLKKILDINKIQPKEIEKEIIAIKRGCSNRAVKIKLPIKPSKELAYIIGKALGDGGICSDLRFFYCNQEIELVNNLTTNVEKVFGRSKITIHFRKNRNNCYEAKFSPVIGYMLHKFGIPIGHKVKQEFDIPVWIKEGNKEIKKNFIKAIFDDECCVDFRKYHRTRRIIFAMSRDEKYSKSLINFLGSLQNILNEFQIKSGSNCIQTKYRNKITMRFAIQDKQSLENYKKEIYFDHPKKREILEKILTSYVDIFKIKKNVLNSIISSPKPLSTPKVSTLNNIKESLARHHLENLSKEGKISRTKNSSPIFWGHPTQKLMNKKEEILNTLFENQLTSLEISKQLDIKYKYVFMLLKKLKKENLVSCINSRPRLWKSHKLS